MNFVLMGICQSGYLVSGLSLNCPPCFSLSFQLVTDECKAKNAGEDKVLSWIQRLEIALDSARGLYFLHTYPQGCIVHRDIKVSLKHKNTHKILYQINIM